LQASTTAERAILLIEDDQTISELLEEYLSEEGYDVTTALDGAAARAVLAMRSFALIVADALAEQHPLAERWSQLETIQRAAPGTPIIICTAHRASDYAGYAARGFSAMITKPFDLEALLALIMHTLKGEARDGVGKDPDAH
jgi:DNA-binding NtrC family response regulator